MPPTLRLLLVEDSEDDALLVLRELRRGGHDVTATRVETAEALTQALDSGEWDAIISDYALPRFDALAAFHLVRQRGLDVPFLIVSGQMGEDTAVAAMKAGVHDFLLKDRLGRLGPAMTRELREAKLRAERRGMQEQLLLSDRLASLGLLSASVAHEINNPLSSLLANLDFLLETESARGSGSEQEQALLDSRLCAEHIREIVRDIKVFSRPEDKERGALDVHRVLDSSLRMARNHVSHRAQVLKDYSASARVLGSEGPLGQIFLNLLINAADAVAESDNPRREIRLVTRPEGPGHVRVEIHDTGRGIPPELRERIFEPFFTTKPVGVGTGLGLAICRRLAQELGARFGMESAPEQGTVFYLVLPSADMKESRAESVAPLHVSERTVLVLDDEAMVGRALQRVLGAACDVQVFVQGAKALERVAEGQRFDAILCDLLMPEMDGIQFYERLRWLSPEQAQRVIFMTGGALTERARAFLATTNRPCLEKPIEVRRLRSLLADMPRWSVEARA
ncbi:hybrid sensor histidine kinase/response regulator [Melittangium boletus]|uniref:histidine kinase n=1 Tax=Melittangium boletus DSM 14713 TaxID=1294270 RepID=A0A250IA77_9BACT|nr:response regulator [Melittangium boletus]ATB28784.1 hybrid sensor histidine kinase/response regulator [Melittangium boletus DSM 14713]